VGSYVSYLLPMKISSSDLLSATTHDRQALAGVVGPSGASADVGGWRDVIGRDVSVRFPKGPGYVSTSWHEILDESSSNHPPGHAATRNQPCSTFPPIRHTSMLQIFGLVLVRCSAICGSDGIVVHCGCIANGLVLSIFTPLYRYANHGSVV
jgi:hypothetical protein